MASTVCNGGYVPLLAISVFITGAVFFIIGALGKLPWEPIHTTTCIAAIYEWKYTQSLHLSGLLLSKLYIRSLTGPQHTWAHHHPVKTCIVEDAYRHVLEPHTSLVDKAECERIGKPIDLETEANKQYYPLDNVLFHVQIPFLDYQIMSRKFHFVITDLGIHFNNDFINLIVGEFIVVIATLKWALITSH